MDTKRGRGRPKGSGLDDTATLNAVADMLVANQGMKPTTAMKRCVMGISDTQVRRLQVKWKADGPALLANAEQRAREQQHAQAQRNTDRRGVSGGVAYSDMGAFDAHTKVIRDMQRIQDIIDPPYLQAARRLQDMLGPDIRALRAISESPTMRAMRDLSESPGIRQLRELAQSPQIQQLQRAQEMFQNMDPLYRRRY